jgi:hypothetical protein
MRHANRMTDNPILVIWGRLLCEVGLHRWFYRGRLRLNRLAGVGEVGRCWRDCVHWKPTIRERSR